MTAPEIPPHVKHGRRWTHIHWKCRCNACTEADRAYVQSRRKHAQAPEPDGVLAQLRPRGGWWR